MQYFVIKIQPKGSKIVLSQKKKKKQHISCLRALAPHVIITQFRPVEMCHLLP